MDTRSTSFDHSPLTAKTGGKPGDYLSLEFFKDGENYAILLPERMRACAVMIAEAFNAHMHAGPITRRAQGAPSGETMTDVLERAEKYVDETLSRLAQKYAMPSGKPDDYQVGTMSIFANDTLIAAGVPIDTTLADLGREGDGDHAIIESGLKSYVMFKDGTELFGKDADEHLDRNAAHHVERRDLP